jgi:putative ABC transport system substrate-binding protein
MGKINWKLYTVIAVLILLIPVWNLFFANILKGLPTDFSYEAEMLSVDNFYNIETGKFSGDEISKSEFKYDVIDVRDDVLIVENIFEVFTFDGEKIISLNRSLAIDRETTEHVAGYGDKDRSGSLFAPVGMKGGEDFTYWHINYDQPIQMKYVSDEEIDGLKVYRYESGYDGFEVDQTAFLGHLEGVPEEKGVVVKPNLEMWVEPVTGMMLKYRDSAESYFYDIETGEELTPWNFFSNEFTESTVEEKAAEIKNMKYKYYVADYVVTFGLFALALALLIVHLKNTFLKDSSMVDDRIVKNKSMIYGFFVITLILLGTLVFQYRSLDTSVHADYKVGIVVLNETDSFRENIDAFVERLSDNGFMEGENLKLYRENAENDERALVEIVREFLRNEVDLIYVLTTTATKIVANETADVPIVFSVVTYPVEQGLVDSLENSKNNLVGVKHVVPVAGQWYEFRKILADNPQIQVDKIVYVRGEGFRNTEIQFEEAKTYFSAAGYDIEYIESSDADDLRSKLEGLTGEYVLYGGCDSFIQLEGGETLIEFSLANNKLFLSCIASLVPNGALFARSVDFGNVGSIAADKATLILLGAKTDWLSVALPQKHKVNINREIAEALGLSVDFDLFKNIVIYPNE